MFKMAQNYRYALQNIENSNTSFLRIAKKYRGWKYNFTFWKSALSKKLGGKYALDSKIIWSSELFSNWKNTNSVDWSLQLNGELTHRHFSRCLANFTVNITLTCSQV